MLGAITEMLALLNTFIITGVATKNDQSASEQNGLVEPANRQSGQFQNRRVNNRKSPKFLMSHND